MTMPHDRTTWNRALFSSLTLGLLLVAGPLFAAEGRGPSTAEERAKALELVELIETSPASAEVKEARAWLIAWLAGVPDIHAYLCLDILDPDGEGGIPVEISVHQIFGQAAFLIENPDAEGESDEVLAAGAAASLRLYDAMRAEGMVGRLPVLDKLKKKQAAGELLKVVTKRRKQC